MNALHEHETTDHPQVTDLSILLGLAPAIKHTPPAKPKVLCEGDLPKGRVWFSGTSWIFNVCFKGVRLEKAGHKTAEEAEAAKSAYLQRRLKQLQSAGQ